MNELSKHSAICLQFIHLSRHFLNNAKVYFLLSLLLALTARCSGNDDFQRDEFLKREYSLTKPYQGGGINLVAILSPVLRYIPPPVLWLDQHFTLTSSSPNIARVSDDSSQSQGNRRNVGGFKKIYSFILKVSELWVRFVTWLRIISTSRTANWITFLAIFFTFSIWKVSQLLFIIFHVWEMIRIKNKSHQGCPVQEKWLIKCL